ncbi:MAG: hypothetical protein GXO12_02165 [Epsilonproteobacteria bacterium]|nr:hypothetical protein [Campylobacterota bacterium]
MVQIFTGIVDEVHIRKLIKTILTSIPKAKIIGATTDGEIVNGEVKEHSTVLSFMLFEKTEIKTYYTSKKAHSAQVAKNLYTKFHSIKKAKAVITFTQGLDFNGEAYIKSFSNIDSDGLTVAGGLAGDNAEFKKTIVFTEKGVLDAVAVAAVLYCDELYVHSLNSFGWKRIGKKLKITNSKDNTVYTIDDIPAADIYRKYLGDDIADELPSTGIEFPLILFRDDIEIARAVIGIDKTNKSLTFAGDIREGEYVQFGYGDIDSIKSLIKPTKKLISKTPAEGIFIYSCMARKRLMREGIKAEIKPLSYIAPVSGFFTYGELFTDNNHYELLNQTMTILVISENSNEIQIEEKNISCKDIHIGNKTIKALTHLVGATARELEELNQKLEEKVQIEVEKNRNKDEHLIKQSRLALMGEMISMIAHQWRQPLSAISSSAGALKIKAVLRKNLDENTVVQICDKILFSTKHLSNTIDDFRYFYKTDKEKNITTLKQIIEKVLNIVQISIQNNNINVVVDIRDDEEFFTFSNEIRQTVMNLVKNAEDVLLERGVENPTIFIRGYKSLNHRVLEVEDNGGGVPEGIKDFIFDPYFSTKLEKDGTGLGLYMSKIIVEEHCGGILSLENGESGALFRIKLP